VDVPERLVQRVAGGDVVLPEPLLTADGLPDAELRAEALYSLLLGEHRRRLLGLAPAPSMSEAREHAAAALRLVVG
jgi:TetR/AcrR family transcriptional regulator, mexJK operon transcriptional repressor